MGSGLPFSRPEVTQNQRKTVFGVDDDFGPMFFRYWLDFGSVLGAKNRLKSLIFDPFFESEKKGLKKWSRVDPGRLSKWLVAP